MGLGIRTCRGLRDWTGMMMPEENQGVLASQGLDRRRLLMFTALFLGFTLLGVLVVFLHLDNGPVVFDRRLLSPQLLVASLLLLVIYFLADGLRLYFTVRALGYQVPVGLMARLVFVNILVSNLTPMATGGGVVQVWYLQKAGVPIGTATAATTIRTTLAVLVIFTLAPVFLLFMDSLTETINWNPRLTIYLLAFVVIYVSVLLLAIFRNRWLLVPIAWILNRLCRWRVLDQQRVRRLYFRIRRELVLLNRGFTDFISSRGLFSVLALCCTFIFLLSLFSFPMLLLLALDYDLSYLKVLGIQVVTTFIMYFSPTPGASGIAEGVFGHFFSDIVSAGHLLILTFAWRLLTIYTGMLIALVLIKGDLISRLSGKGEVTNA